MEIVGGDCGAESSEAGEEEETICALCFAAGTPIHTDQGNIPVEALKVGDKVLASNRTTGKLEYEPISALTIPHHDKLLEIRVEGERDPLRPSTGHPFWVKRGYAQPAWMPTGQMQVNDRLLTIDGQWRRVTAIVPVENEETVYNFTVAKDHDYFVGQTGFLVHNQSCPCQVLFSRDPSKILGSDTFAHGDWEGRTLDEAVAEAQQMGELPEGLELNASWVNDAMVAANNRTLWVAIKAGLTNVPVNGLDSSKIWNTVRKHLEESGGPFEPCE